MSHLIMQQNQMMNVQGQVAIYIQCCQIFVIHDDGVDWLYYLLLDAKYPHEPVAKYVDATRRYE